MQVFDRSDIRGRLLILGQPGSGKTTTLLDLAGELLARAQNPDESIPVLLGLSSWASKEQSILEWLVEELKSKYGVRGDIGAGWLQAGKLLPLLDGLDEVRSDRQGACIEALNCWISGDAGDSVPGQFVICSRIEEYEQLEAQLQMNGAVCLGELSREQICGYLQSVGRSHLWSVVEGNSAIADLVRAPLFLSMMVIGDRSSPEMFQQLRETKDVKSILLDIYIQVMLTRSELERKKLKQKKRELKKQQKKKLSQEDKSIINKKIEKINQKIKRLGRYSSRQTRLWLVWLSQQMERDKYTEFLVERIQKNWLKSEKLELNYNLQVRVIVGISGGIILGLMIALSGGLGDELIIRLIGGTITGLSGALSFGLSSKLSSITPVETISWSWRKTNTSSNFGLSFGLIFGLSAGLMVGVTSGVFFGLSAGLIVGLTIGLIIGVMIALVGGLSMGVIFGMMKAFSEGLICDEIEKKISINQGIWKSLKIGLIQFVIGGLIFGLMGGLSIGFGERSLEELLEGLSIGLMGGLIFGLRAGLEVCIKHFVLRKLLFVNGFAPWNYARFLISCTDSLLLQQVGGRFRFIHKSVQEHFAAMYFEKP